ncbi:hypothetical protein [Brasilonema bromeliae]|uniref:TonB C-terminal domain-containing protein n=1 Tax=Brasilonema bromeliae SPC951 TaxID=385972 RepID=A0ABX1P8T1_9CYAN|nr:hypothetical protein [Brasilonema bromeliae]NMG20847.1 hypothetical protein [Brasilonema bromeliae SPC951]
MSYVSLLKNIPEFLSQPTGIAVLASLGIHSAIAFLLPIVPTNSNKPKQEPSLKSSVGLVELSQSEKNRLPQPGIPQLPLQPLQPPAPALLPQVPSPKFANQSIPSLPPLPPSKSSTALILPPLPKTNNLAVASLPKSQSLPILSKKDLQPASLSAKVKPLPRNVEPDPSLSAKVKRLPGYAEPDPSLSAKVRSLPRYPEKVELGEAKPLASSKIPYNVPPIQAANIAEEQELLNTSAPVSPDQMPPSGDVSTATQTTAQGSEVSQGANNQQLVTPVVQPPQVGDNSIALGRQNLPQLQQGLNVQPPELPPLATGRSLSTPSIASTPSTPSTPKTFAQRFTEVKQQYPNLETRQPIAETVDGKTGQQGNVEGDLVINREGQVESIDFHNNSVPSELKTSVRQYFREYFQKNPVQANGKPKFYPFNISFKPNSDISKTPASELSTSSRVNQTQPVTIAQRSLIQRLRSVPVTSLPSKEPQKIEMTQGLRPDRVNLQPSKEPQKVNLVQRSGSSSMKQSQSQTESAPQANLEQQTSRRRRVIVMQNTTPAPQANLEQQTSQQRVMIRQSASSSQTDKEQQTSQQRVVVRQSASSSQTDKEQQTSPQRVVVKQTTSPQQANLEQTSQQEVNSNQSSASGQNSQKLLQQLRQIRDTRQGNNQEK